MKVFIKTLLKKFNLFYSVKYSILFQWYQDILNPKLKQARINELEFYTNLLGNDNTIVFDIGANCGNKTLLLSGLSRKVIALEPDQESFKILSHRFSKKSSIYLINKAVTASVGEAELFIQQDGSGLNTLSQKWKTTLEEAEKSRWDFAINFDRTAKVTTTTLQELIQMFGKPNYIKIDVEGYEKQVILGLKEYIPLLSFECNLPEFYEETLDALKHLQSLCPNAQFNYYDEKAWGFSKFIGMNQFMKWFSIENKKRYFEIFCQCQANSDNCREVTKA